MEGCIGCSEIWRVHVATHWVVEHCVGRLGVGTWIVKPKRHVTAVGDLSPDEAAELGTVLSMTSRIADELVSCEQVYNELWSHAGDPRGHIHYVVLPVTTAVRERFGKGPNVAAGLFAAAEELDVDAVDAMCDAFRHKMA